MQNKCCQKVKQFIWFFTPVVPIVPCILCYIILFTTKSPNFVWLSFSLKVVGTMCLLFVLAPQLAPILGALMLAVSVLVGKLLTVVSLPELIIWILRSSLFLKEMWWRNIRPLISLNVFLMLIGHLGLRLN